MSNVVEIDAARPWWRLNLRELWGQRDLFLLLLRKDLLASYKQSVLGPAWFVIQPLFMSVVFGLIFGRFAKLAPPHVPNLPYFLAGLVLWSYFQSTVISVSASLGAYSSILRKIYFPRLIVPLVAAGVSAVHFVVNYLVFLLMVAFFSFFTAWNSPFSLRSLTLVLLMPAFITVAAFGFGIWLAAWSVHYRDLRIGTPLLLNLWMFATPIIWPLRMVPVERRWIFALNPMTSVVELHRAIFLGTPAPETRHLAYGVAVGVFVLVVGWLTFSRVQGKFVDTI